MSPRSLLFSSDQETLHIVGQVLKELGLEVESCLEIFSAIEKLTTKAFDVVVADLDDGAEAAFLLKTCQELNSTRSSLVVAIAGVGMSSAQPGAGLVLNKPLIPERMKWSLTHWEPFSTRLTGEPDSAKVRVAVQAPVASKRGPVLVKSVKPTQMPPTLRPRLVGSKPADPNRVDPKQADARQSDSRRVDLPRHESPRVELPQHRVELPQEHVEALQPQQDTFDSELIPEDGLVALAESASAKFRGHAHSTSFTATPRGLGFLDDKNPLHVRDSYLERKGSFSRIYRPMMMAAALLWLAYIGVQPARSAALVSSVAVIYTQAVEHTQSWLKAPKTEQADDDDDDAQVESRAVRHQAPRPERVEVIHLEPLVPMPPAATAVSSETTAQTTASNSGPGIPDSLKSSLPQSPAGAVAAAVEAKLAPSSVLSGMQPVLVSEELSKSMVLNRVEPDYPKQALSSGLQGAVVLQALIGRDGKVTELKLVRGYMILGKAASDAVRQWRFRPYILNGQAVDAQTYITVDFKLPNT